MNDKSDAEYSVENSLTFEPCLRLAQAVQSHSVVKLDGVANIDFIPLAYVLSDLNNYDKEFGDRMGVDKTSLNHLKIVEICDDGYVKVSKLVLNNSNDNNKPHQFYPLPMFVNQLFNQYLRIGFGFDNQSLKHLKFLFINNVSSSLNSTNIRINKNDSKNNVAGRKPNINGLSKINCRM